MSRPPVTVPHRSHKGTVWTDVEEVHCKGWLPSNEKRVMVVCSSCSKRCHSSCEGGSPHTAGSQMFYCNSFRPSWRAQRVRYRGGECDRRLLSSPVAGRTNTPVEPSGGEDQHSCRAQWRGGPTLLSSPVAGRNPTSWRAQRVRYRGGECDRPSWRALVCGM
ncbi:hypothetical protein GWK47_007871 [Chionoecetes opilio]|uniref:Uncharacterized protein n=1 Tax=Chionoecetes opilio TaxID=41210 RepID=A0A8J4XZP9_CHIOP|nr:hypothetical protein GWK47_007871 [Chionoecetes opilio]